MLLQSSKMGAQVRQKLAPLLLAGAFFVCLASGSDQSTSTTALAKRIPPLRGAVKVGGWTQVNERWPVHPEADYFFAVDKGHHFIQVKLPARLQSDLIVTLKYYYAYAKVRPFFQIVPCKTNVDILSDKLEENSPDQGSWHVHQMRVKRADCEKRKELAYNVLLHDANDFFAWSSLEIRSADESQNNPTSRPTTAKPAAGKTTAKPSEDAGKTDQPIESDLYDAITIAAPESPTTPKTTTEESLPLNDASKPSSGETTQVPTSENSDKINEDSQKDKITEDNSQGEPEKADLPSEPSEFDGRSEPRQFQYEPNQGNYPEPADESESEKLEIPPESPAESDSSKGNDKGPSETMGKREAEWDEGDQEAVSREKRAAASPARFDLTCKPSMCNRNMVNYPRFMKLIGSSAISNGPYSPASAASRSLMYLNTKNQPLGVQVESDDHDFGELNLCLDMNLYMDAGTKLSLMLGNDGSANGQKLLEIIERKSGDSATGKWERVKRCLSDYMPRLRKPAVQGDDQADTAKSGLKGASTKHEEIHKVNLSFVPQSQWPDKQKILVNLMRDSMVTLKEAPAILQYLPNVVGENNSAEAAKRMWTLDQDGIEKAEFKSLGTPESLRVEQIDPTQEYFDLTSRWIKLDEPEVLDNSVLFHYKADKAAWIKALDFEFQNVDQAANVWRTERVYSRAEVVPPTTPASKIEAGDSKTHYVQRTDGSTLESSGLRRAEDEAAASGVIATPIRLRGLNGKEFRIRLRHHVDKSLAAAGAHQLNIRKLAFGDACALEQAYCLNGGACRPTGISKAKCTCRRGYSGKHCEVARPCDVLYAANMTGYELCHSIGARCVEQIPVFKCIWPDDRYYQCKALEAPATHPAGQQGGGASGAESSPPPLPQSATERLAELEANAAQQQQLIIVMAVFMASLMLFAIVIVINMIMKLRKSNRRLKTAQIEVYELNRQNTPGTSSSAAMSASAPSFGRAMGARNKQAAPATITYNNRAFDATGQ